MYLRSYNVFDLISYVPKNYRPMTIPIIRAFTATLSYNMKTPFFTALLTVQSLELCSKCIYFDFHSTHLF
jgi:hypothetical protein